jgi:hypothetical protein
VSPSSVNYKLKCSAVPSPEQETIEGLLYKTIRTATDKSVWGICFHGRHLRVIRGIVEKHLGGIWDSSGRLSETERAEQGIGHRSMTRNYGGVTIGKAIGEKKSLRRHQ